MGPWTTVFSTMNLPEAELIKGLLIAHDIEAIVIDQRPSPYPNLAEVNVMVQGEEVVRARFIVDKHNTR